MFQLSRLPESKSVEKISKTYQIKETEAIYNFPKIGLFDLWSEINFAYFTREISQPNRSQMRNLIGPMRRDEESVWQLLLQFGKFSLSGNFSTEFGKSGNFFHFLFIYCLLQVQRGFSGICQIVSLKSKCLEIKLKFIS